MQRMQPTHGLFAGPQSVLDPAGEGASAIAQLSWTMIIGGTAIFLCVMALLGFALVARTRNSWLASRGMILAGGLAFPIVVLSALLLYGLLTTRALTELAEDAPLSIRVTGEQFWWRVRYDADADAPAFDTANEIRIPTGRPVRFSLATADVIHSFWIPNLGGKLDMIPGQTNTLVLRASRPGVFRGQCTEFCGSAHALMAFDVVVDEPGAFQSWRNGQLENAHQPQAGLAQTGGELFQASGCGACHAVRGTAARGRIGPDLTHVGSRRTIAAGTFLTNQGTLAGWIAGTRHLKPGSRMPPFNALGGEQLRALAAYLESLN